MSATRQTVNIMEAVERCGVSRRTIYNWLESGQLQYVRTASGRVRIFADSLFVKGSRRQTAHGVR